MMDTTIREATREDYDQWKSLRKLLSPDCSDHKHNLEIDQILSSKGIVLIAEQPEAGMIGFAEISLRSDHVEGVSISPVPYLEGWFVLEDYRRQGIGSKILTKAIAWASQNGYCELASDVELQNIDSIQTHIKFGFNEVGKTAHFLIKTSE